MVSRSATNRGALYIPGRVRQQDIANVRAYANTPLTNLYGSVFTGSVAPNECYDALAESIIIYYLGFNNNPSAGGSWRGIGEYANELYIAESQFGIWKYGPNLVEFDEAVPIGQYHAVAGTSSVATTFGAQNVAVSWNSGVVYWGEADGRIYKYNGSTTTHIGTITAFASTISSLTEWDLQLYSTSGDLSDESSLRLIACGLDVAGLYDIDPAGSAVTYSSPNITGGSVGQSRGIAVNNCGGIWHGRFGSDNRLIYRSQSSVNTAVDTGHDVRTNLYGPVPSATRDGSYTSPSSSLLGDFYRYDGSSYNADGTQFSGWEYSRGSVGPLDDCYVNVISNTSEIIRIYECAASYPGGGT